MIDEFKELIKAGKLTEVRQQLVEAVKNSPGDPSRRTLLVQVLCYLGEWEKADRHLQAIAAQDSSREAGALGYRNLINAELERCRITDSGTVAPFLTDPPEYLGLYSLLREKIATGKTEEAKDVLGQLDAAIPQVSGKINDKPFQGFYDSDTLLFPFLEVIAHDRYLWVPFDALRELSLTPPKNLLDLLWIPAHVMTWEGYAMNCYLPTLYPNTFLHEDAQIRMGRMTDWVQLEGGFARGVGQHVYEVGGNDVAILEVGDVTFNIPGTEKDDEENG